MRQSNEKTRQKMLQATIERDEHFKLYKAGKVWLVAGLATFAFALAPQVVHAATIDTVAQTTVDQTAAADLVTSQATSSAASSAASSAISDTTSSAASSAASSATSDTTSSAASDVVSSTTSSAASTVTTSSVASSAANSAPVAASQAQSTTVATTAASSASVGTSAAQTASTSSAASATGSASTTVQTTRTDTQATSAASDLASLADQLPAGTNLTETLTGIAVDLPVGADVDQIKQQLRTSGVTTPITLTAKDAAVAYRDTSNKVNVTLSTDTIGYGSDADTLTVGLRMTLVAGDVITMTFPTDSPIINWGGYQAVASNVGVATKQENADGTTTYTLTATGNYQVSQDITLNLTDNNAVKTISAADIGTTQRQITWTVNGVAQTPITVTQTIQPETTIGTPTRTHPSTTAVPTVSVNNDLIYSLDLGESTGAKDDTTSGQVSKALNTGGATVTIPVPASFLLNETATAVYNTTSGTTITQPGGAGGDIVITVAANTGADIYSDSAYTLVGQYQMAQPGTATTLTATSPITFTQTYDDGTTTTVTGPTWTETIAGDQETGNSIKMTLTPTGNSSAASLELVLNGNTADDPETVSSIGFTLNADQVQTGTFVLTIPDGVDATSITTPKSGIMAPEQYVTDGYYLPGTTSYTYTLTLADGTVETGTVAAGDTITPTGTASIRKAEFTPNELAPGAYTTDDNDFQIHGHLTSTYANGQAVKNGDTLKFVYDYVAQFANGVTETTTTNLTETIVSEKGLALAWDYEYGTAPGDSGVLRLQANGNSKQTTDSIYEPILYFVIPKNTTITGYNIPDGQHPVITQYTTADGRTGVKMDFTGTGESVDTSIKTLDNLGVNLINSLDAVTSTSAAESYITSPTTALINVTKVTDASLTAGDTNAVQMNSGSSSPNPFTWTVTTADYIGAVTMAQGNQDADLSAAGKADERGDETLTYTYTMVNGSGTTATNTSVVLNLPTTGDTLGSTFTYDLTGPVSVPTTYSMSGTPLTATVLYSKQTYTTDASATAADLTNFVTAAEIGDDWASVRAVYINFNSVPAQDTTGRVTLTGTAEQFIAQGTHVGYLNSFTFYNGSPVSEATTATAAKITINGTSTVTAQAHYVDANGDDQYVALDDLTKTLTDNQDKLENDYPTTIADFSEADQALLPVGYSLTETKIVNSDATYANNMPNNAAVLGGVSQYDYDGDIVQFELTRDQPTTATNVITKVVHYVDENGTPIADDYVDAVTITQITDQAAGTVTYEPSKAALGYQADPTITGYTVTTDSAIATSSQTVTFGSDNIEVTVVYSKNPTTVANDTITKTVHYRSADGTKLAGDYTTSVILTKTTDTVTGMVSYTPISEILTGQANPTITGYHVVTNPAGATTSETVEFGDANLEYTVVYNLNTPTMALDTVTKTVHYVDQDGKTIAPDYTSHANITRLTGPDTMDPTTGDLIKGQVTYGPATSKVSGQANPTITGYHVVTNPAGATTNETVEFGDADLEYTVVYNKDTPQMNLDTVTKTVHYVDQDGKTIAPDYTSHANITELIDPVTGDKTYGPATSTVAGQDNPTLTGYHVVTNPAGATTNETVEFGDADLEYTVVYNKNTPKMNLDTVTKTVHYVDQDGQTIAPDYTSHANITELIDPVTGEKTYGPATSTVGGQDNPTLTGYHVVTNPAGATTNETVEFGDADLEYTVVYNKNTPQMNLDTVTKTVHYVDQDGNTIAPDYTSHANITELIDPVTGEKTYGPATSTVGGQANPTLTGYHVVTNPAGATTSETVEFGDADLEYTVVYNKDTPQMNLDTVTKTVHYVDQDGQTIAPDYTSHANITELIDPVTGEKTYGPATSKVNGQANPTLTGYHVVTNPAGATTRETVEFGDADLEYTVVYNKDTPQMNLDTVTKTVHYVDQDGQTIAPDYTSHANITELIDPVTGEKTSGPATSKVNGQANPTITGYHVVTNPAGATTRETVEFGDADLEYTVVYNKNTPQMNLDTVTKTVHYVDQDGQTVAPDYTSHANITELIDPVTGEKTYGSATSTVSGQANPTIAGYHVVTNPVGAITNETVEFGDADFEYTVVYNKDTPQMNLDTVTKTVHYVDQDGQTIAPDYTSHANITELIDSVTGDKTYGPAASKVAGQASPTITGYHVVTNPAGATTSETVEFGDADLEYTVVYNKDTPQMNLDTVTKTVHYVDQDGQTIAPDYTSHANITELIDSVTGDKTYGPATSTVSGQANPTTAGYHVVTNPAGATSSETVEFGDTDLEYTVVYNKDAPQMNLDTVTKTVHYVDQDGKTIAPDYTSHANITELIDPVTGEKTYGPATSTVSGQANPTIAGYHVVTNPTGATTNETVAFGDADLDYTVIYAANPDTDDNGTPGNNGGTTTPNDNGGTTPGNNGGTTTPGNSGGTTTPNDNGETTPDNNGGTTTPSHHGATTTPDNHDGTDTPGQSSAASTSTSETDTSTVMPTVATTSDTTATPSSKHRVAASNTAAKAVTTLPQTGEDTQSQLALLGASMLALLGFVGYRRKRD
ncbi:mucin-binding protein [Loigolactobacillus bifermentans]|uniref:Mucus binding protein n=1 Tax=Loigolactobacillus bifermentans DSM 20003 TaxID=1423726 RepID=A0A0R1GLY0_9LACO|nr:LPXTG cell wall anchor domain-containing protein [Loigolactobacillus bifermentans]KRK33443.1 mucus binding protein [Loigolactobacillus bifermentans DSM 20003]QGG61435.1 LPXTG cell wall anchor domain-containing protein [Loigolactobacillus bifermentans]